MNPDLGYKDVRVPTFIPYEVEDNKKLKRKRSTQQNKKRSKKAISDAIDDGFEVADVKKRKKTLENQVWVGAAIDKEHGAYSVYYGEDDERNFSRVYAKENELQDLEYAYVLGTLKAIESLDSSEATFIVNTTCRDLRKAIEGRAKSFHHKDLSDKIRDVMKEKEQDIQVRHVSGRASSSQYKAATMLAEATLKQHFESENVLLENKIIEEEEILQVTAIEEPVLVIKEEIKNVETIVTKNDDAEKIEEKQIDSLIVEEKEQEHSEVITTTTVTTITSETEVETIITEVEESRDMDLDCESKDAIEPSPSSWTSVFGIRNLLDILYAPFKTRKSN